MINKIFSLAISLIILLGTLLLTPAIEVNAAGSIYYVSKTGADTNLGTQTNPWLTIQKAANTLKAGDTVFIMNGTYSEYVYIGTSGSYTGSSGTESAPITYKAYPGHNPVISCSSLPKMDWRPLITIGSVSNIIIDGLELRDNPYTYGIILTSTSRSITLRNLKIHNILKGGIMSWGVDGLLIDNCEIYDTNQIVESNEQVSMMPAYNFEIKNCKFYDSGKNSVNIKCGSSNGKIHHNQIWGTGYVYGVVESGTTTSGIYIDAQSKPIDNIEIYNNAIHGCRSAAIVMGSETSPYAPVTNVNIYNNLLFGNHQGFVIWPNPFTRSFRLFNNTFYDNKAHIAIYGDAGTNMNCEIKNNIISGTHSDEYMIYYFASCGTINIDHNLFYNSLGIYRTFPAGLGTNFIKADPLFVASGTNFQLTSGSLAIDSGIAAGAPLTDYLGTPRNQDTGYDIGAYEYFSIVLATPVVQISSTNGESIDCVYSNIMKSQTIKPLKSFTLNTIRFQLKKSGNPSGNVEMSIKATDSAGKPVGNALATSSISCTTLTDSTQWHSFSFINDITLEAGIQYAICLSAPQGNYSNRIWYQVNTTGTYPLGFICQTYSSGIVWTALDTYDAVFEIIGR
ncbi:MAG: right-handed parallel beta-helix repeat-containing protein [Chitinispirillaceae bacterium]|nr:right-handed parallel beta-helix repeat-containing protein [Chitinispirillaceae bacterium]